MNQTLQDRFWSKVNKNGPLLLDTNCWEWTACQRGSGYGGFAVWDNDAQTCKHYRSHRLAYELEYGAIPDGFHVLHKCDNRLCVRPEHLFLGTNNDNMTDRDVKGRNTKGTEQPAAKLTDQQVLEIRQIYSEGGSSQRALGKRYGVSAKRINQIVNFGAWKHL